MYPSHSKYVDHTVWRSCESSLKECHIEQTTVETEELEKVILDSQRVVIFHLSSVK